MYGKQTTGGKKIGLSMVAAALLFGTALAAAQEVAQDKLLADWLGKEFTVESSTPDEHMPKGGKFTLAFDAKENVVHVCTRTTADQATPWRMDFATSCGVTMSLAHGTRYCTIDDVKTGNAEVLASCHRLRTHDVAMRPSQVNGAVELNDLVAYLVQIDGQPAVSIQVDSPARLTEDGSIIGTIKR
jgi:hypothetical protein